MKKNYVFVLILLILQFHSFSEIINWKGMEFGADSEPVWLEKYIKEKNEKPIRKRFEIENSQSIILGIGRSDSLENARLISQLDAQQKVDEKGKSKKSKIINLQFLYEYWVEDSESGYTVYSLYLR